MEESLRSADQVIRGPVEGFKQQAFKAGGDISNKGIDFLGQQVRLFFNFQLLVEHAMTQAELPQSSNLNLAFIRLFLTTVERLKCLQQSIYPTLRRDKELSRIAPKS